MLRIVKTFGGPVGCAAAGCWLAVRLEGQLAPLLAAGVGAGAAAGVSRKLAPLLAAAGLATLQYPEWQRFRIANEIKSQIYV